MAYFSTMNKKFGMKAVPIVIVAITMGIFAPTAWQPCRIVRGEIPPLGVSLAPMNLTLVGLNGAQLELDEADVGNLPSYESYGAYKNVLGNIRGWGKYTGVPLTTFCNLVGGIAANNSLQITAVDNYTTSLTYEEVNGDFITYDNTTGQEVPHNQPLTPIVAYYFNDADLSAGDGPLRLAIVGPEGLATFSGFWVKQVVKLEIRYRDEVTVTAVTPSKTVVGQNHPCRVNVTVANQGAYDETFNVTAYANQTAVGTQTASLSSGDSASIVFTWNTTGFALGNYSIRVRVRSDNLFMDCNVLVSISGDVNGDGKVNIVDVTLAARGYGSEPGDAMWNFNADLDDSSVINIVDIAMIAREFGKSV